MTQRELRNLLNSVAAALNEARATLDATLRAGEDRVWEAVRETDERHARDVRPAVRRAPETVGTGTESAA